MYSWRFSRYSATIHGHMTSNNETVSRQMPLSRKTVRIVLGHRQLHFRRPILLV